MLDTVELSVTVPKGKVAALYRYLSELHDTSPTPQPPTVAAAWTQQKGEELRRRCWGSRRFLAKILHSNRPIDPAALAKELDKDKGARSLAGVSGAVGNACRSMNMPLPWRPYSNYEVPPEVAEVLRPIFAGDL